MCYSHLPSVTDADLFIKNHSTVCVLRPHITAALNQHKHSLLLKTSNEQSVAVACTSLATYSAASPRNTTTTLEIKKNKDEHLHA